MSVQKIDLGFDPKEKYTHAPEILEHSHNIGEKYDLYKEACFQTEVTGLEWDEQQSNWIVRTNRNDAMRARLWRCPTGRLTGQSCLQ